MKAVIIVSTVLALFALAGYSDGKTMQAERDWCIEADYTSKPVTNADVYQCNKYGVTLSGAVGQ